MKKAIRNTVFTVIAVSLTATSISWNKKVQGSQPIRERLSETTAVLAVQETPAAEAFAFKLSVAKPYLKLNQSQVVTIETLPNTQLEIVVSYPNGSVNNSLTRTVNSDEKGQYRFDFKLSDFRFLGLFQISVTATNEDKVQTKTSRFILQRWIDAEGNLPSDEQNYLFPLEP